MSTSKDHQVQGRVTSSVKAKMDAYALASNTKISAQIGEALEIYHAIKDGNFITPSMAQAMSNHLNDAILQVQDVIDELNRKAGN